eukprot:TRINITY_DN12712_c0_g1_i1.p2 TRINITY_DN12712_c0_g1~~TRINITY_DN12712_c0_g1_i1.p2  ORF type:complete len:262 (+),score=118.81 TRINITY_DN12712_c0_g1_i1:92-787(+)
MSEGGHAAVRRQVEQMKSFIIEEAKEKAQELEYKAMSEAERDKQENLRRERAKKDAEIHKELEAARMRLRVKHAKLKKQIDDEVLQHRVDAVDDVQRAAEDRLAKIINHADYKNLLQQLTVQGAFVLEGNAKVRCRPQDRPKIQLAEAAKRASQLLHHAGRPCDIRLSFEEKTLSDAEQEELSLGGVFLTLDGDSKITCDNTVVSRLSTCLEEYAPVLRHSLFLDHKIHAA